MRVLLPAALLVVVAALVWALLHDPEDPGGGIDRGGEDTSRVAPVRLEGRGEEVRADAGASVDSKQAVAGGAWEVVGRVVETGTDTVVPGAVVRAELVRGRQVESLGERVTNEEGWFGFAFPDLAAQPDLDRTGARVRLSAWADGWLYEKYGDVRWEVFFVHLRREGRVRRDLVLKKRASIRGRVVDAAGEPVAGAHVAVTFGSERGVSILIGRPVPTDARGEYQAPAHPRAPRVLARAHADGVGASRPLDVPAERGVAVQRLPDLVLESVGVLQGTTVFPDGTVAAGVGVKAWIPPDAMPPSRANRTGAPSGSAVSDSQGRFRIAGLRPGRFEVGMDPPRFRNRTWSVPSVAASTGDDEVRVEVPFTCVRVRAVDEFGAAAVGAWCVARYPGRIRREDRFRGATGEDGTLCVWARRGETLRLAVVSGTLRPAEREVVAPTEGWVEDVTLILRPLTAGEWGRLRVEAKFADGAAAGIVRATFLTPLTGTRYPGVDPQACGPDAPIISAPAGRWRVALRRGGFEVGAARWVTVEREVVVPADGIETLSVVVGAPGDVELHVTAEEGGPPMRDLVVRLEPREDQGERWIRERYTTGREVWALPPGAWRLRATAAGYGTVRRDFVVEAGADVPLHVHLVPE